MYNLEDDVAWTNDLKNAFKHGIVRAKIKYYDDNNNPVIINENNGLKHFKLYDEKNIPEKGFIGEATSKQVDLELLDITNATNLENKEFELFIGADYNNQTYYINYGKFIITKAPEIDTTNGNIKITAFDYMIKFNDLYIPNVTFPCTMKAVLDDLCIQSGVILATQDFANSTFIVENNQFQQKTRRDVLRHIAKSAFSWARIGQDNKLYLDFDFVDPFKLNLVNIKGDTFQQTYEGKNQVGLVDLSSTTTNGITYSIQDGVFSVNGTASAYTAIELINFNFTNLEDKKLQIYLLSGTWTKGNIGLVLRDSSNAGITTISVGYNTSNLQRLVNLDAQEIIANTDNVRLYVANGAAFSNVKLKIMIVDSNDTTIPEYEQYVRSEYQHQIQIIHKIYKLLLEIIKL